MVKYSTREYLRCYWKFIRPYLGRQIIAFVSTIFSTLLGLTTPLLTGLLIDHALKQENMSLVYIFLGISLGCLLIQNLLLILQDHLFGYIRNRLSYDLRMALFKQIMNQDIFFFQQKNVGELMSRIIQEVRDVLALFSNTFIRILIQLISFLGTFGVMFYLNWKLTIFASLIIPLLILTMHYFNPRLKECNKEILENYAQSSTVLQQNLQGVGTLKNYHKEGFGSLRFAKSLHILIKSQMRMVYLRIFNTQALSYLYAIGPAVLVLFGSKLVINHQMTIGVFVAFYGYLNRFYLPVRSLAIINVELQQTLVAFYRYYDLLHSFGGKKEDLLKQQYTLVKEQIKLDNITFSFDKEKGCLIKDFSLELKPGTIIGITGRNGIGKSTLFGLISGLYEPFRGFVKIDGIPIRELKKSSLQKLFGIVPQETYLFNMSIMDNIALGSRNLSQQKIDQLAKMLNIYDFIESLPDGFATKAEKNGENFSGGQRQKIGIMRALVHDPQILLLDEATSAIDVETENNFFTWLAENKNNKIIFFISHKPHLLQYADIIVKFADNNNISIEEKN